MTESPSALTSLRHRSGVGRRAHSGAFSGTGASSSRRLGTALLASLIALAGLMAIVASPASAATSRAYQSQLTEAGSPLAPFTSPAGLAVDESDNLYVSDSQFGVGPGLIDKFNPSGSFLAQGNGEGHWTGAFTQNVAFSDTAGLLYVADSNFDDLWGLNPDTTYAGVDLNAALGAGCCVIFAAADNSGTAVPGAIYVSGVHQAVVRIDASGAPLDFSAGVAAGSDELTGPFSTAGAIAVAPNGNFYVAETAGAVFEFEPSGAFVEKFTAAGPDTLSHVSALAVDPTSGNLLIAEESVIYELGPTGVFEAKLTEADGAPFAHIRGLAVDSTGSLYVADSAGKAVDVFAPAVPILTATTGSASNLTDTTATLTGTVNDATTTLTECRFQYVTEAAFQATGFSDLSSGGSAECSPAAAAIPVDSADHPVHADLPGLSAGVVYRYRLIAANATELNQGAARGTPTIVAAESVSDVAATSADLQAEINPNGVATGYHFEYLTEAAYEQNGDAFTGPNLPAVVPIPDASIPAGQSPVAVRQAIGALDPATAYRYRVATTSSLAAVHGPGLTFTTQTPAPFALPDARRWELVSPPDKHGSLILPARGQGAIQAAASGDAISYLASGPTEASPQGNANLVQVLSSRGGSGWSSRDLPAPHEAATGAEVGQGNEYRFFSPDLSQAVLQPFGAFEPSLSPEASEQTAFLRTDFPAADPTAFCTASCYRPLVTAANVSPEGTKFGEAHCQALHRVICGPFFLGATPAATHVVLGSLVPLTPGAPPGGETVGHNRLQILYEWSAGQLQLISVRPGSGGPAPAAAELKLGSLNSARNAISADGSRVIWSERVDNHHLYLRDTEAGHEETLQLDLRQGGSGAGNVEPIFQTASADGSVVFFTDTQQLTRGAGAKRPDLYECKILSGEGGELECELTDLTPESSGEPADVQGAVPGASEDGSSVYFVANGVLAHNVVDNGAGPEAAQPGDCNGLSSGQSALAHCNLYLSHAGQTTFIATLSGEDHHDWSEILSGMTARISPDGDWLAFMSGRPLTGYDNRDASTAEPDQEVYLYHAGSEGGEGSLVCASCNPTGARPRGVRVTGVPPLRLGTNELSFGAPVAAVVPTWNIFSFAIASSNQPRYLSDAGRLFFNSSDALVPSDSNGTADVYTYEPPQGEGAPPGDACTTASPTYSPASGGCVDLISSGTSAEESAFLDASESGDDIFFLTAAQLSKRDTDTSLDVYDARVGGGEAEAVKPVECEGDGCQQPAVPPGEPTLSTSVPSGPGNIVQCPKGKVKKSGKCVKKHSKKHKHHKKSKKRHAKSNRGAGK